MRILVQLISGQNAPNYFASEIIKPDKQIFIYSKESCEQLKWIKSALNIIDFVEIDVDPFDFENCTSIAEKIFETYKFDELILNFTNGTKIMSSAFFNVFNSKRRLSIYIDSQNKKCIYIKENNSESNYFSVNIPIENYLKLYGHKISLNQKYFEEEEFEEFLLKHTDKLFNLIEKICKFKSFSQLVSKINSDPSKKIKSGESFIEYDKPNKKINFHFKVSSFNKTFSLPGNDLSFKFITGGWFENAVYNFLKKSNLFSDIQRNINVKFRTKKLGNPINEIDVAAIYDNSLYIFEVKSGGFNQNNINKLRSIKENIGGTYAKPVFITNFPIKDEIKERLNEYAILHFQYKNLGVFLNELKENSKNINL